MVENSFTFVLKENDRLRKVLEFYADENNWTPILKKETDTHVEYESPMALYMEPWERARKALKDGE